MKNIKCDDERTLIFLIYHSYYCKQFGRITNPRAYYDSQYQWLKAQGCHVGKKVKWDSDAQRVEFMLRWL